MEKEKLVVVTSKEIDAHLREDKSVRRVYPLKSFCVGYPFEFDISNIDDFVLVNRLLTDEDLNILKNILINRKIKGIVFDDLGILEIVKDLKITKILLLNHLANSVRSINYYLDYVDSIVTSSDLTQNEIKYIMERAKKPLILNTFGLIPLMYSRRNLLTNYSIHNNLAYQEVLDTTIGEASFKVFENPYGTVFYTQKYYLLDNYLDYPNVLYYYFNPVFLSREEVLEVLKENFQNVATFAFLQNTETTYKLKGGDK